MGSPRRQSRRTTRRSCRTNVTIPNASLDAERIVEACKQLTAGSRFLNIGAGFGFFPVPRKRGGSILRPSNRRCRAGKSSNT